MPQKIIRDVKDKAARIESAATAARIESAATAARIKATARIESAATAARIKAAEAAEATARIKAASKIKAAAKTVVARIKAAEAAEAAAIDNVLINVNITDKLISSKNLYMTILEVLYEENKRLYNDKIKNIQKIINFLNIISSHDSKLSDSSTKSLLRLPIKKDFSDVIKINLDFFDNIANEFKNFLSVPNHEPNFNKQNLFFDFNLSNKEDKQHFITIDPTIIQIMIFDDEEQEDIVYSLKLIIRDEKSSSNNKKQFYLRYTTMLFPKGTEIISFDNLTGFNNFNKELENKYMIDNNDNQLTNFLLKSINFYELYKKCYNIEQNKLIDYQLKYISILGKARFSKQELCIRTGKLTDYIMSNLLFTNPTYAFISGGYKGFKQEAYGITRSGYEIAKKYNRPILTIMCKEGMHDYHEYSDSIFIYGEHWGEDTIALSQLTDGAIIIAPFGGWTYIECLSLLKRKKIVAIYNDFYNILNYNKTQDNKEITKQLKNISPNIKPDELLKLFQEKYNNKINNINFFLFAPSEQNSIIDYYINYYLILMFLIKDDTTLAIFKNCLKIGIQILSYLKTLFANCTVVYKTFYDLKKAIDKASTPELKAELNFKRNEQEEQLNIIMDENTKLVDIFNKVKNEINNYFTEKKTIINSYYKNYKDESNYQDIIPDKCDGIWIKPKFNFINDCVKLNDSETETLTGSCSEKAKNIFSIISKYQITFDSNVKHAIFTNLNTNIIFVFSDIMYLSTYLNTNLNTNIVLNNIKNKIDNASKFRIEKTEFSQSVRDLLSFKETNKLVSLNRNMDGMYNIDEGVIFNQHIIKDEYTFIIDNLCNNYIIETIPETPEPSETPAPIVIGRRMIGEIQREYNKSRIKFRQPLELSSSHNIQNFPDDEIKRKVIPIRPQTARERR